MRGLGYYGYVRGMRGYSRQLFLFLHYRMWCKISSIHLPHCRNHCEFRGGGRAEEVSAYGRNYAVQGLRFRL